VRFDPDGHLLWARQEGGPGRDYGVRVLLDSDGCSFVTGRFGPEAVFGEGSHRVQVTCASEADLFMACYDALGNLLGALRVGGTGPTIDQHWTVVMDELGNRYLVGDVGRPTEVWKVTGAQTARPSEASRSAAGLTDPTRTPGNPPARFESIARQPDGSIQIVIEGRPDGLYLVEGSVDLREWVPLTTPRTYGGRILIEDRQAAELPMRFYRVRQPCVPSMTMIRQFIQTPVEAGEGHYVRWCARRNEDRQANGIRLCHSSVPIRPSRVPTGHRHGRTRRGEGGRCGVIGGCFSSAWSTTSIAFSS
jgi:hypothetical protein